MPLVQSIAGDHFPKAHIRRYIQQTENSTSATDNDHPASVMVGAQSDFEYDAIAMLIFEDEIAFQAFFGLVNQPEAADKIAENEEMFLDRSKMKVVILGKYITSRGPTLSG